VRWLADECVDAPLVRLLREQRYDVVYMAEHSSGATDEDVLALAQSEDRLLLTEDKDFGELVVRWHWRVPGLVLLRIEPQRDELKWIRLSKAISTFGDRLFGRYVVIEESRLRSRDLIAGR
jgi:predicted nuclease of predicted toxin-antitoxin system